MAIWFEGNGEIETTIEQVKSSAENLGGFFLGVISLMPSLTSVELVEQGNDFVTIRTNEGLMKRTNISKRLEAQTVVLEFDEEYQAGSAVTTKGHFLDEFTATDGSVRHHITISGVEAPGLMGFFYRKFGSSNTGNAFLASYKQYLEQQ